MAVPQSSASDYNITNNTTFIGSMGGVPLIAGPAGTTVIGAQSGVMVAMLPQQQTLGAGGIAAPMTYTAVPAQPANYGPATVVVPAVSRGYAPVPVQPMSLQQPPHTQAPVELQMRTLGSTTAPSPAGPSALFGATSPAYTAVPQNVAG
jgi:hypothetical protein